MGAPSVPYKMSPEGFEITSDDNGFRAQATFVLLWEHAFTFHDEVKGITSPPAWVFPGSSASRLYARDLRIRPVALDEFGQALPITSLLGMAPGEFWKYALVEVTFETPTAAFVSADDAGGSQHFDPAAPLYGCEQSVRIGTRAEPKTGPELEKIKFDADLTVSPAEATVYKGDSHLMLHWPFVNYVPWQKYRLFNNTINSAAIFDCAIGQLLFLGADVQPAQGPGGKPGRSVTIDLAVGESDWNKLPHPTTGVPGLVNYGGDTTKRLYTYKSFSTLAP